MKRIFVEARYMKPVRIRSGMSKLPRKVHVFSSIQYLDSLGPVRDQLTRGGIEVFITRPRRSAHPGQLLGCSMPVVEGDAALYIGDGDFHPLSLAASGKPIFKLGPDGKIARLHVPVDAQRRQRAALARVLTAERIGILVSVKTGQSRLRDASLLKRKLVGRGCRAYIFLADSIDFAGLADFNFIDAWVNTACPRIGLDDIRKFPKPVANIDDLNGLI
jgi:2-(3-amino-3-carboxypropyl)histidine synthase